jgi:predicted phage terminase large subunit-like protein
MPGQAELDLRARAKLDLLEEDSEFDLGLYITLTSPNFRRPTHLAPLLRLLDASMKGPVFATVSVPPRHFKTETLIHGAARMMRFHPDRMNAYATYSSEFAERKSRRARDVAQRGKVPLYSASKKNKFNPAQTVNYWQTIESGGFLAVGRGSGFTGDGVTGLLIIDDPHKDRQDAESARMRQEVWEWFTDVALSRVEHPASVIVTHTRWHEDDLIGRIRRSGEFEDWHHINLPALALEQDPIGREFGEALLPWKFSRETLLKTQRRIGEYSWWSLYQGEPRPRGGRLFAEPHYYTELPITAVQHGYGADLAYTAKTQSDYSVLVHMIKAKNELFEDVYYILNVDRRQVSAPTFGTLMAQRVAEQYAAVFWRAVGPERGSVDLMNALLGLPLQVLPTTGDKFIHAQPFAAAWNAGRVRLPAGNHPWVKDFVEEITKFTGVNDPQDDQVDAAANAFDGLSLDVNIDVDSRYDDYLPRLRQ